MMIHIYNGIVEDNLWWIRLQNNRCYLNQLTHTVTLPQILPPSAEFRNDASFGIKQRLMDIKLH